MECGLEGEGGGGGAWGGGRLEAWIGEVEVLEAVVERVQKTEDDAGLDLVLHPGVLLQNPRIEEDAEEREFLDDEAGDDQEARKHQERLAVPVSPKTAPVCSDVAQAPQLFVLDQRHFGLLGCLPDYLPDSALLLLSLPTPDKALNAHDGLELLVRQIVLLQPARLGGPPAFDRL